MGLDIETNVKTDFKNNRLKSNRYDRLFLKAYNTANEKLKDIPSEERSGIDCLRLGYLQGWSYESMLNRAINQNGDYANLGGRWSAEEVRAIASTANWNFTPKKDERACYWVTRLFLETCANAGLSIGFYH